MKPLAPNSLIQNRYLIVHLIGKGGMGEVYLAVDQRLGSAIALKRTFFADDEMLGGAFEREARTLARLRHPVLPKVSDHFTENGEQYLVMEHIAGDDLSKRLEAAQKPFPLTWVLFWSDQLLDALAYLHSHEPPIIHRDIKPQNLKLTDENHIVLLDFGLSKNSTGQTKATSGSSGSVVGYTPHYAPMEQIRGTGTNPRSDIYSLSATLYQLMTNTVPDDALTRADALLNGKADPIVPLNEANPEVPKEVSDVILRGMEVSQEKRYSTAKEMQKALRKAFSQMQEAMSAQTIAFSAPGTGDGSSKIEQPVGVAHSIDDQRYDDADSQATRVRPDQENRDSPMPVVEPAASYNGPSDVGVRQSDVKTEVYHAGSTPLYTPAESEPIAEEPSVAVSTGGWDVPSVPASEAYSADATQANVDFSASVPATPFVADETFASSSAPPSDPFATRTAQPDMRQEQVSEVPRPAPVALKPKKKSKAPLVIGALAGLFILGIVAVGAGWFAYTNYFANAVAEATPTPAPTVEFTPTPEPTLEAITDANSNTSIAESNSNSSLDINTNTDLPTVEPTPNPELQTRDTTPGTRPQQNETRRTATNPKTNPGNSGNPGTKATPKKTNRTVILQ
jgi:serine/threonine protein kinase